MKKINEKMDYTEAINAIALNIKNIRTLKNITVQDLAYRCDIERSNMSRIEAGRSNCTIKTLCKIATALDVTLIDLIEKRL